MTKKSQKAKVLFGDVDVSHLVFQASLPLNPDFPSTVDLSLYVDSLDIEPDGTLVIRVDV